MRNICYSEMEVSNFVFIKQILSKYISSYCSTTLKLLRLYKFNTRNSRICGQRAYVRKVDSGEPDLVVFCLYTTDLFI